MKLTIHIIDAFTDTVFKGNSAGVICLEDWLEESLMQAIAAQNNLSETAFLVAQDTNDQSDSENTNIATYHIRWFSPMTEIDFCGHATLASAFLLFQQNNQLDKVQFYAKAVGHLIVNKALDGKIQMNFPNNKPKCIYAKKDNGNQQIRNTLPDDLINGLSIQPSQVYKNTQAYFVVYEKEQDVLSVKRDNERLAKLAPLDVVVTSKPESAKYQQYDFISRYFWPANGGDEDPVTGSAHTGLAPLWAELLGKDKLLAYQASSRGGELECEIKGDRVFISGHAVQYLQGVIEV